MMDFFKRLLSHPLEPVDYWFRKRKTPTFLSLSKLTPWEDGCFNSYSLNITREESNLIIRNNTKPSNMCNCLNCKALSLMIECRVCLEPLQGGTIKYCIDCSNLICWKCSLRLRYCAFCKRFPDLWKNSGTVERLLDKMILPCRNARFGCDVLLSANNRFKHEEICQYSLLMCPQYFHDCNWYGHASEIKQHIKNIHELESIQARGVSIEIDNIQKITQAERPLQYKICLLCFDQLFSVEIFVFGRKLKLSLKQLGCIKDAPVRYSKPKLEVLINIDGSCKSLKGILPFGSKDYISQKIDIECQRLYTNVNAIDEKDFVKIDLIIKRVNNS